jgi:hypothetical protein
MRGKGMVIGNEEKALVLFLHPDETFQGPEIVSEVKVTGWPDSAYYNSHLEYVLLFNESH